MKFSEEQQQAINVRKNCVVSAGAGSGKTAVLSERFLALLLDEKNPVKVSEILTLTFTKKAAGEMRDRIFRKINEGVGNSTKSPKEKERLDSARKEFSQATITTLDAFCLEVVENAHKTLKVPGGFIIDAEAVKEIRRKEAVKLLEKAATDSVVFRLMKKHKFSDVINFFIEIADSQISLFQNPQIIKKIENQEVKVREILPKKLVSLEKDIDTALSYEGSQMFKKPSETVERIFKILREAKEQLEKNEIKNAATALMEIKCPGGKQSDDKKEFFQLLKNLRDDKSKKLLSLSNYLQNIDEQKELAKLLDCYGDQIQKVQRRSNLATFKDIAEGAIVALSEDKELRQLYKEKFKAIMIDEFQDNNELQKNLLFLLAEKEDFCGEGIPEKENLNPEKLFFVGDEKQSIYKFRGADVSVFRGLQKMFETLELSKNYRSEPGLIEYFNALFPLVMTTDSDNDEDCEAVFKELSFREATLPAQNPYEIELARVNKAEQESKAPSTESEFIYVAQWIKERVGNEKFKIPTKDKQFRLPEYKDFLVLLKSTSKQGLLEQVFRYYNIPYNCEKKKTLFSEAIAVDFQKMLKAAVYPNDKIAHLAFFRSPLCQISDDILTEYLKDSSQKNEEIQKAEEKLKIVKEVLTTGSYTKLFRLFWYKFGYRYYVIKKERNRRYEEFSEFLLSYLNHKEERGASPIELLADLPTMSGDEDENLFSFSEGGNEVSVMTIHKSKGLEAPFVILPQLEKTSVRNSGTSLYLDFKRKLDSDNTETINWLEFKIPQKNFYFEENESPNVKSLDSIESQLEKAELKRLLYVALTRAEHYLLMTCCETKRNTSSFYELMNVDNLFSSIDAQNKFKGTHFQLRLKEIPRITLEEQSGQTYQEDKIEKQILELSKRHPQPSSSHLFWKNEKNASSFETEEFGEALPSLPIDGFLNEKGVSHLFGTYCHNLLEAALNAKDFNLEKNYSEFFNNQLAERRNQVEEAAYALVKGFLQSDFMKEHCQAELLVEKEFLLREIQNGKEVFITCRMDLIIKTNQKIFVVDFKTDHTKNPTRYEGQLELYRKAVEGFYNIPTEGKIVFLRENL